MEKQENSSESKARLDMDQVLKIIGEFGRFQRVFYVLICLAAIPTAFFNLGIVFIAAQPNHWCMVPELQNLNLSTDDILNISIPLEIRNDKLEYSQCKMYYRNYSQISQADDISSTFKEWKPNETKYVDCQHGWQYDDSQYESTIAMQVRVRQSN